MNNNFIAQFSKNIKFSYTSFDRGILRGYILDLFYEAGVASFLKSMGFVKRSNGVMRIFTDPPANRLDTLSFKQHYFYALLTLLKSHILSRPWRAGIFLMLYWEDLVILKSPLISPFLVSSISTLITTSNYILTKEASLIALKIMPLFTSLSLIPFKSSLNKSMVDSSSTESTIG